MTPRLRRKRVWDVADFAEHMQLSHWQAKALLKRLDEELHGMLLRKSGGKNRRYSFFPALLFKERCPPTLAGTRCTARP